MQMACLSTKVGRALDALGVTHLDKLVKREIEGLQEGDMTPEIREFMFMLKWPEDTTYELSRKYWRKNVAPTELNFGHSPAKVISATVDGCESRYVQVSRCSKNGCGLWISPSDPDLQDPMVWSSPPEAPDSPESLDKLSKLLQHLKPAKKSKSASERKPEGQVRGGVPWREPGGIGKWLVGFYPKEDTVNPWRVILLILLPVCLVEPIYVTGAVGYLIFKLIQVIDFSSSLDRSALRAVSMLLLKFIITPFWWISLLGIMALVETIKRRCWGIAATVLFGVSIAGTGIVRAIAPEQEEWMRWTCLLTTVLGLIIAGTAIAAALRAYKGSGVPCNRRVD